ncbi:hypothetical protein [Kineosporia babensis]|uniref:Uncharacterized protein n=1 Tax=Kineosporia babensis TaxID=499548 RepID=A0A9X1NA99_9ACTN|nr:hypothetical protein [Kineosporia babensis]MCD5310418.1 hypothetical protein [Kineosporia babensis]
MIPVGLVALALVLGATAAAGLSIRRSGNYRAAALFAAGLAFAAAFVVAAVADGIKADETGTTGGFGLGELILFLSAAGLMTGALAAHRRR